MRRFRIVVSLLLSVAVMQPVLVYGQQGAAPAAQGSGFKLTVIDDASEFRRAQGGRVSSQAVVQVTDENDVPVAGIAVTFTIPQFVGGATFANGAVTSIVTTNAAGLASSTFTTAVSATASNFSITVAASVPGQVLTTAIPVDMSAAAAAGGAGGAAGAAAGAGAGAGAGGGISGALIGVLVAVGVAGAVVAAKTLGGQDNSSPAAPAPTPRPTISISLGQPTVGAP